MIPILAIMLVVPAILLGALAITKRHSKKVALLSTTVGFLLMLYLLSVFLSGGTIPPESHSYLGALNILLNLNVTPIGMVFLMLSAIVLLCATLSIGIDSKHPCESSALIMLFQIASVGLFLSSNLYLLFIFWDIGVIAMFFMIYFLGSANRRGAAMKFLLYEIFASGMLFLGIIFLVSFLGTANIQLLMVATSSLSTLKQIIVFLPLLLAFLINMPVFPFHLWLPEAHTEAPTEGSMILSGVLTKFGGFGMLLLFEMLPIARTYTPEIAALAVVSAFYSVFVMMKQTDLKRIIAYSTITDMAIVLLALTAFSAIGQEGALVAMVAHAVTVSLMFLLAGIIHKTYGERDTRLLKGIITSSPILAYVFIIGAFSMVGLPLTATFIGEIMVFIGSYSAFGLFGLLAMGAVALMGAFLYLVIQKVVFETQDASTPIDSVGHMPFAAGFLLLFFIFVFGLLPYLITAIR
jgi:NADH-quinone oxidoreductase subunit M